MQTWALSQCHGNGVTSVYGHMQAHKPSRRSAPPALARALAYAKQRSETMVNERRERRCQQEYVQMGLDVMGDLRYPSLQL